MAVERQRGLGRGLAALLGEAEAEGVAETTSRADEVRDLPVEALRRNPDQPRRSFSDAELEELTDSIRDRGVLQPILVRRIAEAPDAWQIVAGERRWRAAQRAGLARIPVIVRELTDSEVLEIAVVENVQRADLTVLEEAQGYRTLIERFGHTQDAVGGIVGKSRSHIANALRLLDLPEGVLKRLDAGQLSAGHARAIAAHPDVERLADEVVRRGLNVRQAEALARGGAPAKPIEPRARAGAKRGYDTASLEHDLAELIGIPSVEIIDRGGKGELRLGYGSIEQLDELCDRLTRPAFNRS